MVYLWYQTTLAPSLANKLLQKPIPGELSTYLLHGILLGHDRTIFYIYAHSTHIMIIITAKTINASISRSGTCHLSYMSFVLVIGHFRAASCTIPYSTPSYQLDSDYLIWFDFYSLIKFDSYLPIWFDFRCMKMSFNSSHSYFTSLLVPHGPECPEKFNSEIVEYSRILKTQIGFGDNTLFFSRIRR